MAVVWGVLKFRGDAQKCYDEVQTLGNGFTPNQVLDLARNPKTELHKCFDWNDTEAAEKWRIHQARQVCRSFVVKIETADSVARTYRVVQHDDAEQKYKPVVFTVRNKTEYDRLLEQAKAEMISFRQRYSSIAELESVIKEIEKALNL